MAGESAVYGAITATATGRLLRERLSRESFLLSAAATFPLRPREKWQFMVAITATGANIEFAEAVFGKLAPRSVLFMPAMTVPSPLGRLLIDGRLIVLVASTTYLQST